MRIIQRESTRRNVLAAARALFCAEGVDAVSMEDVAHAANVGRATVYLHFTGKHALLVALLTEDWASQLRLFRKLGDNGQVDDGAIESWLGRVIDGMRSAQGSFAIHRIALGQDERLADMHRAHRRMLASVLLDRLATLGASEVGIRVEAVMIVAEIEYLAAAAAVEWNAEETAAGVKLMTDRLAAFAARPTG
ncbi:TetR/AcrR family transcriptional regulator [uncultured Sphingomonas sp.]|uniref:TetR/AcrR family transcriptional regulator n=1 Tax=uncultured Sphingomonas sp. TaxID=158754 RepID=UPI0035CA9454